MRFLTATLLSLFAYQVAAHEGHQAFYNLSVENGALIMVAKLELPDTEKTLEVDGFCSEGQDFNFCAGSWLINQLSITIDGKIRSLRLDESYTEDGHLFLKYGLGEPPGQYAKLEISNTAFVSQFSDYENILQIAFDEDKQGYKMDKDRTTITINLNQ